jgi:N-acetylglucosaminyldiphosphoundecaprenol N-acetyl-beta-D-mannosaminyltransferase
MKIKIFGIDIDNYSLSEAVDIIIYHASYVKTPQYIVTPNAHHLVMLQRDKLFREIYRNAFLSVPDGVPLLWVANLQNTPLQGRVNGTDLFQRLCAASADQGLSVFLLGGRPGAAELAVEVLKQKNPQLKIAGTYCPPYGFEADSRELAKINQIIKAAAPDLLFVGLGAPKQEKWMAANYQELGVPISVGIGVSFELVGGVVKRAPKWMQQAGLEWFYRFLVEPQRLFKRTIIVSLIFIGLLLKQQYGSRRRFGSTPFSKNV